MTKFVAAALLLATPLFAAAPKAATQAPADHLKAVIDQMDAASGKFKSAQADLTQDTYERVIKDVTTDKGSIYFKGHGSTLEMGLRLDPPATRIINYKGGVVRIFDLPPANQVTEVRSGQVATYLAVAFGGSGTELQKTWDITDKGSEKIDGVAVEHLDLVSKDPEARKSVTHVEIWVDPTRAISLKQQIFQPGGDYKTSTYRNIRYNQKIDTGPYEIKTDKATKIVRR